MAELKVRHELNCSEDTFWKKIVFDPKDAFNRHLYDDLLKFPNYQVLELKDEETRVLRKVRIEPPVDGVPGPVKKVIGDRLSYLEEDVFDKATKRFVVKVTPSTLAEKIRITGEMFCESLGENRIARVANFVVEVKVFMVGGMIEEKIISDLKKSYDTAAGATNAWLKSQGM